MTKDAGISALPPARPTLKIDNDRVRVTQWDFAPGEATGWHRHAHDYVVVPMTDGQLTLVTKDGTITADLTVGGAYARPVGVEHDVQNLTARQITFIEIEIK